MNKFWVGWVLVLISSHLWASIPSFTTVPDQRVSQGELYEYQPQLEVNQQAHWIKTFGPDDVVVNPIKGTVSWQIPADLPSESFHIGVKAINDDGVSEQTWILTVGSGNVIYIGPSESLKTLKDGMDAMASGDTLVMRNGEWDHSNQDNTIPGNEKKGQTLPAGSAAAYTTLMAEDPGKVIIDGKNEETLISLWGATKHPDWPLDNNNSTIQTNYLAIKGLVLLNSRTEAVRVNNSKYIKLINLGIGPSARDNGSYANLYVYRSQYVLLEGLYVWGNGRYKVQFKNSSESVVRRSVARIDNYIGGEPIGGYISYCSRNILFQNNILVDSDHSEYWGNHNEIINAFGVPATNCEAYPEYNEFKRSLALNNHMGLMNTDARQNVNPTLWEDIVGWDLKPARHNGGDGGVVPILSGVGATTTNRMTLGEVDSDGGYLMYSREKDSDIFNSIFYRIGWVDDELVEQGSMFRLTGADMNINDNDVFGFLGDTMASDSNAAEMTSTYEIDPEFQYITMLPRDSELRTANSSGERIGAELMTMLGRSGTFYGEEGYDSETNIPMWPFPIQGLAHEHLSKFTHSGTDRNGGTAGIKGNRGFAVAGQSLTNYVWGYTGSVVPPFNVVAIDGNEQAKLMWEPPAAIDQADIKEYRIYKLMNDDKLLMGTVDAPTQSYTLTGLSNAQEYKFVVTAVRSDDSESDYGYYVSSTPVERPRPKPPVLTIE